MYVCIHVADYTEDSRDENPVYGGQPPNPAPKPRGYLRSKEEKGWSSVLCDL